MNGLGTRTWIALMLGASLVGGVTGCQSGGATDSPPSVGTVAASAPAESEPVFLNGVEESNFALKWQPAPLVAGAKAGQGELVLVAKAPFKCNQEYPYKFKLTPGSAIPTKTEIAKPDIVVAKDRVVVPVSFEVSGPEPSMVGVFAFSVCTDDKCLIERKTLKLTIDAPAAVPGLPTTSSSNAAIGNVVTVGGSATQ